MNWKMMLLTLIVGASAVVPVSAADGTEEEAPWTVGLGAGYSASPYKEYDNNSVGKGQFKAIPIVSYEKGKYFVRGTEVGVKVFERKAHSVEVGLSWHSDEFSPKDTDDAQLKLLDKRKPTAMADVAYTYKSKIGISRMKASVDVLGRSKGVLLDASHRYPIVKGKKIQALAGVGVEWASGKQNDYYYGVSQKEAQRSGLSSYTAGSGFTPYLSVEAKYDISKRWGVFAVGKVHFLNSEVKDSPMVDRSTTYSVGAGVLYKF